jgi:selenide,water dikinase
VAPTRLRRPEPDRYRRFLMEAGATRHLVLVGGGHAHVHVLRALAMRPEPGLRVTVVSPASHAVYSGMVPGVLAGRYEAADARIDVRALAARARATFLADRVVRIDAGGRRVELAERPGLAWDLLSLDVGSRPADGGRVAADAPALMVKPIEVAAAGIQEALARPPGPDGRRAVVVGAGAGGTEIALALSARLRREGGGRVTVCDRAAEPARDRGERASRLVRRAFDRHGIEFVGGVEVVHVGRDGVRLAGGRRLAADLVVWATGAAGPPFLAGSGLPVDERGFLRVGDDLRLEGHPAVFAAGDCATLVSHPGLAKAGVYAVRQGPVLARNLRAAARGETRLEPWRPQRRFLSLLNTGDGRAILSWGTLATHGRLAWRLKDWIDRRFVRTYAPPPLDRAGDMAGEMVPCGGCAAKLGADVLGRVLARLDPPAAEHVVVGLRPADDAAVFAQPPGTLAAATADAFPPFADDLYLVGGVAAVNAAGDLYAMGAEGTAAVALVCLPTGDERLAEEQLEHFLRGALTALAGLGIPLVGGHTVAGEQALVGFAMHGAVRPDAILRKAGARPGDVLVLTKPLGTGVVLAAARAGVAPSEWVEAAYASMLRSNAPAMRILREHGARAATDVTGFGLGGHLAEMVRAGGVGARLHEGALPALPGARELLAAGWRSTAHATNVRARGEDGDPLLDDPQTSGGLLAALPATAVEAAGHACAESGEAMFVIGEFTGRPPG